MNLFTLLVLVLTLFAHSLMSMSRHTANKVLGESITITVTPSPIITITPLPPVTIVPKKTMLVYPNSTKSKNNFYITNDSPQQVISWYKSQIETSDFSNKTVISTNTNGNAKAIIKANGKNKTIDIIITKDLGESQTQIEIR